MKLVVDASVVAKWFFDEDSSDLARELLVQSFCDLLAPELLIAELANVFWRRKYTPLRFNQIMDSQSTDEATGWVTLKPMSEIASLALRISLLINHPVYDAFYLVLAEKEDAQIVTADRRFLAALSGTPYASRAFDLQDIDFEQLSA